MLVTDRLVAWAQIEGGDTHNGKVQNLPRSAFAVRYKEFTHTYTVVPRAVDCALHASAEVVYENTCTRS